MDNLNPQLIPNLGFSPEFILLSWESFLFYHCIPFFLLYFFFKQKWPTNINIRRFRVSGPWAGLSFCCCLSDEDLQREGADRRAETLSKPTPESAGTGELVPS